MNGARLQPLDSPMARASRLVDGGPETYPRSVCVRDRALTDRSGVETARFVGGCGMDHQSIRTAVDRGERPLAVRRQILGKPLAESNDRRTVGCSQTHRIIGACDAALFGEEQRAPIRRDVESSQAKTRIRSASTKSPYRPMVSQWAGWRFIQIAVPRIRSR